jgi:hypothetical protein
MIMHFIDSKLERKYIKYEENLVNVQVEVE